MVKPLISVFHAIQVMFYGTIHVFLVAQLITLTQVAIVLLAHPAVWLALDQQILLALLVNLGMFFTIAKVALQIAQTNIIITAGSVILAILTVSLVVVQTTISVLVVIVV